MRSARQPSGSAAQRHACRARCPADRAPSGKRPPRNVGVHGGRHRGRGTAAPMDGRPRTHEGKNVVVKWPKKDHARICGVCCCVDISPHCNTFIMRLHGVPVQLPHRWAHMPGCCATPRPSLVSRVRLDAFAGSVSRRSASLRRLLHSSTQSRSRRVVCQSQGCVCVIQFLYYVLVFHVMFFLLYYGKNAGIMHRQ